jgi:hypothetical protein
MLGVLAEGMRKVVKGIGIILMDILSEVDPEVFGFTDTEKNSKDVSTITEQLLNKKISSDEKFFTFYGWCPYGWCSYGWCLGGWCPYGFSTFWDD